MSNKKSKVNQTSEECESCRRYLQENEQGHNLCNTCAAGRYWSLKEHIRNNLVNYRELKTPDWSNLHYNAGVTFERRIKRMLEARGWFVARSAGSKGKADLIAIQAGVVLLIQCKRDFRDLADDEKRVLMRVCGDDKYLVPIHARYFNRIISLTDLRTGKDVTSMILHEINQE